MIARANFYVYVMFRPNGSPCYIGKGKRSRIESLHSRSKHLLHIINKHGPLPKLKIRENLTESQAFEVEIALISAIGRAPNGPLVNLTDGGEGASGAIASAAKRAAISAAQRGRKASIEARAKLRASHLGKKASPGTITKMKAGCQPAGARSPHSPESYEKQAAKLRGRKHSAEHRAKIGAASRGKKISAEHLAKIRAANLGKACSAETRSKLRNANIGKKASAETRAKMSAAHRARMATARARNLDL